MFPTLTVETGLGRGRVAPMEVELPYHMTFDNLRVIIQSDLQYDVVIERVETDRYTEAGPLLAYFFTVQRKKKFHQRMAGILWWRKLVCEYIPDPDAPALDMALVGYFRNSSRLTPAALLLGCAYNFSCDSMATCVSFSTDTNRMIPFADRLMTAIMNKVPNG